MSGVADRIKGRFQAFGDDKEVFTVPEWEATFYCGPWVWGQVLEVQKFAKTESLDFLREVIRVKAKAEDGRPAFDRDDIDAMKSHGEASVVQRVGTEILERFPLDFNAEKK